MPEVDQATNAFLILRTQHQEMKLGGWGKLVSTRKRNWILALLFLGWALGNLDCYIMNYAVLSITEDLSSKRLIDRTLTQQLFCRLCTYAIAWGMAG